MVSSTTSQRSRSVSTTQSRRANSRSRSRSGARSYSRSRSRSGSSSVHSFHSDRSSRSKSRRNYSRSHSDSTARRSGTWSRSHSRSIYSSRSRSISRSRSRSVHRTSHRSFFRSRTRSRSYGSRLRSRSRSHTENTSPKARCSGKDPRDRSKRIKWTNNVWIIGEKAKDTVFHFCDICNLPIVIYGRLLPCKHVVCYTCAMNLPNKCNRCQKGVQNVERCLVGGIFMCFESDGCRRTYLSQRDLQAHIDHRHRNGASSITTASATITTSAVCELIPNVQTVSANSTAKSALDNTLHRKMEGTMLSNPLERMINSNQISILGSGAVKLSTSSVGDSPSFVTSAKTNSGLLPLPSQLPSTSLLMPPIISSGVRPAGTSNLSQIPPFPRTPGIVTQNMTTPSFLQTSIPPLPIPLNRAQTLPGASAVAAFAAAVSAAMCAQSKSSTSLSASLQQPANSNTSLQATALNASLITNALRMTNSSWAPNNNNVTANSGCSDNININNNSDNVRSGLISRPVPSDLNVNMRRLRF